MNKELSSTYLSALAVCMLIISSTVAAQEAHGMEAIGQPELLVADASSSTANDIDSYPEKPDQDTEQGDGTSHEPVTATPESETQTSKSRHTPREADRDHLGDGCYACVF